MWAGKVRKISSDQSSEEGNNLSIELIQAKILLLVSWHPFMEGAARRRGPGVGLSLQPARSVQHGAALSGVTGSGAQSRTFGRERKAYSEQTCAR